MDVPLIRSAEFSDVISRWAYMNHANVAPRPRRVAEAEIRQIHGVRDNGVADAPEWTKCYDDCRALAARLINARPTEIALVSNTNIGVNVVAQGLRWKPGDNVVLPANEFPSNYYPWHHLTRRGVELRTVPERDGAFTLNDIAAACDRRTRVLALSWVEFVTGFRFDLPRLGDFCRRRGIFFFSDVIQGLGALQLDVKAAGLHAAAAGGYKWLMAGEGSGLLYIDEAVMDQIDLAYAGWTSVESEEDYLAYPKPLKKTAARFETGTLPTASFYGLRESLRMFLDFGPAAIEQRVLALTDRLCERLSARGIAVFSPRRTQAEKSGIVAFHPPPGTNAAEVSARLISQGIYVVARAGFLRASPHFWNSEDEIDRLVAAVGG